MVEPMDCNGDQQGEPIECKFESEDRRADDEEENLDDFDPEQWVLTAQARWTSNDPFIRPSERADEVPLCSILPKVLDGLDPRRFFPDFDPVQPLRFSRLFGSYVKSTSRMDIWYVARSFHKNQQQPSASIEAKKPRVADDDDGAGELKDVVPFEYGVDQETLLMSTKTKPVSPTKSPNMPTSAALDAGANNSASELAAVWRHGPAAIWWNNIGLPPNATTFDYGMRRVPDTTPRLAYQKRTDKALDAQFAPDAFQPYNLVKWEDNIMLESTQASKQVLEPLAKGVQPPGGWIPLQGVRTHANFQNAMKTGIFEQAYNGNPAALNMINRPPNSGTIDYPPIQPTARHSILPPSLHADESRNWEDDIMWSVKEPRRIPQPILHTLDVQDEPLLFGWPADGPNDPSGSGAAGANKASDVTTTKKSKMILGAVAARQKRAEEERIESTEAAAAHAGAAHPFNLSNDLYYLARGSKADGSGGSGSNRIQHATPAQHLHRALFPTHLNAYRLRHFHRMPLSRRTLKAAGAGFAPILTVAEHMRQIEKIRAAQRSAEVGGGDLFCWRDVEDLSARDSLLVMFEYCEEHPPLMSQPGMASKIRNYYKRKAGAKETDPELEYGELAFAHSTPFLGQLAPGQVLQALENNLYRAPVYPHASLRTDFLLIRRRHSYYVRPMPAMFVVGQELPLYEVPCPNSKRHTIFVRDFLMAFIYRLFWASEHKPRRLKMEDVKTAFPHYAESSVRKRLKQCADFKRLGSGPDQQYWLLRSDFRLPSREEVLAMVSPEQCCAQYSMMAAEQRLKDAGYGEASFLLSAKENADDEDDGDEVTMEDEMKCAPWNTTRAFLAAQRGKCMLDQQGVADPTGCGHGFSFVRVSSKPPREELPQIPKRLVTGTNADLRKLPLKEAKQICRDYGVREDEINALRRWEIIDVIRTLSTNVARARPDQVDSEMARFARGNLRFNYSDMQDKFKKHCQTVFDLQNQTLASAEVLSTDEGSSDGDDSDNEALASRLEQMVASKGKGAMDAKRRAFEDEEAERQALMKDLLQNDKQQQQQPSTSADSRSKDASTAQPAQPAVGGGTRKLKIYRTYKHPSGTLYTRCEVISRPQLIEAYERIRTQRDDAFIQAYAKMDDDYNQEKRKEKRRVVDPAKRAAKRPDAAEGGGDESTGGAKSAEGKPPKPASQGGSGTPAKIGRPPNPPKQPKPPNPNLAKMRCSSCGGLGHMKTNRNCPNYNKEQAKKDADDESSYPMPDEESMSSAGGAELVAMEGTKMRISKKIYQPPKLQPLKIPRSIVTEAQAAQAAAAAAVAAALQVASGAESTPPPQPSTSLSSSATDQPPPPPPPPAAAVQEQQEQKPAMTIVSAQLVVTSPPPPPTPAPSSLTTTGGSARRRTTAAEEDYLTAGPSKTVHRARADPRVTMGSLFLEIVNELKQMHGADAFHMPVSAKAVPDYYNIIDTPMDLQKMRDKCMANQYEQRVQFLADVKQIVDNSMRYNGLAHPITGYANAILTAAATMVTDRESQLMTLEKAINPLLDDDDRKGFSHILLGIIETCKNVRNSAPFHSRVDAKKVVGYYERVERPMDLGTMEQRARKFQYLSVAKFREDIQQIATNSRLFNGEHSPYTQKAIEIAALVDEQLAEKAKQLAELEANLRPDEATAAEADELLPHQDQAPPSVSSPLDEHAMSVDAGALHDDLAMSGDEDDDENETMDDDGAGEASWTGVVGDVEESSGDGMAEGRTRVDELSTMARSGQLNNDLALSDSDDSIDSTLAAIRRRPPHAGDGPSARDDDDDDQNLFDSF